MNRNSPLRYAVIIEDDSFSWWQAACIEELEASNLAKLYYIVRVHDTVRSDAAFAATRFSSQIPQLGPDTKVIECILNSTEATAVREPLLNAELDFILLFSNRDHGQYFKDDADLGVWTFAYGDLEKFISLTPGFWEIYHDLATTKISLLQLRQPSVAGVVLKSGCFGTVNTSLTATNTRIFSAIAKWPALVCREIQAGVASYFVDQPIAKPAREYSCPSRWQLLKFALLTRRRKAAKYLMNNFFRIQWTLGTVPTQLDELLGLSSGLSPKILVRDDKREYLADPFVFNFRERTYIFCERFVHTEGRGEIAVLELENGAVPTTVIKEAFHLSYPQVVELDGVIYCVPETTVLRKVLLYEATEFPYCWKVSRTLIDGFAAVDSTLAYIDGLWWLFCTNADDGYNSHLYLWYAANLLGPWAPHLRNPVKIDVRSAGPAGSLIAHKQRLLRPAQDCSRSYGRQIIINEVLKLSPSQYVESEACVIYPDPRGPYRDGLHTIAAYRNGLIVDMLKHRFDSVLVLGWLRGIVGAIARRVGIPPRFIDSIKKRL